MKTIIFWLDTSELRFGGVQKLILELETRPRTEAFRIHANAETLNLLSRRDLVFVLFYTSLTYVPEIRAVSTLMHFLSVF